MFPSEWDEPFGSVPIEAMAGGVPAVATATGGAAAFRRDRDSCLLFRAQDPATLADAGRALAEDRGLVGALVEGGGKAATMLTIDRYASRLLDLHAYWS